MAKRECIRKETGEYFLTGAANSDEKTGMFSRISFLILLWALMAPGMAYGVECSYFYAAALQADPPAKREKLLLAARKLPKTSYDFLLRNTVNDYKAAWSQGSVAGRPYRILRRLLFAPRVRVGKLSTKEISAFYQDARGKDLGEIGRALRAMKPESRQLAAEEKVQWLSLASEPAMDGVIEVSSKLKQKFGPRFGKSSRPLKSNLSIPGGVAINLATGWGTYAYLSEKLEDKRQAKLKSLAADEVKAGVIGAPYLAEWAELGFLDPQQMHQRLDWNARKINEWGKNLSSSDPNRPLPPRFYQFLLEGLLENETVSRFEDIALYALQEAQRNRGKEADGLKHLLLAKLSADPVFGKKSEAERKILAMAFEPPVFVGENSELTALEALMEGSPTLYLDSVREQSDLYWMLQLAKNSRLKPVRELFPEATTAALPLVFANLSAGEERSKEVEKWFPASQLPALQRADYFKTLFPSSTFLDERGGEVELKTELDYLREWQNHPLFQRELESWRGGRAFTALELDEMREKTNALQLVHELQREARAAGRPDAGIFAPDPSGAEACFLAENDSYLKRYLAEFSPRMKSQNFCRYLLTLNFWRMGYLAQKERTTHEFGAKRLGEEARKLEGEYLTRCADPAYQQEFAKSAGLSFPKLEAALSCNQ